MKNSIIIGLLFLGMMLMNGCEKRLTKEGLLKIISPVHGDVEKILSDREVEQIIEDVQKFEVEPATSEEVAVIETTLGTIKFVFLPNVAPNHCTNFKRLANCGFFNGTTFHRVIPHFMIQGGDILSRDSNRLNDGTGGPGFSVDAEFNSVPHERGIVSMARAQDPNSAGSQFFICVADCPQLNNQYSVFGRVIAGMDVVDKIVNVDRDPMSNNPYERVIMKRVYVIPKELDVVKK